MSKKTVCLSMTNEIREMADRMQGETPASVKSLIETYQKVNNIDPNQEALEYPSIEELQAFREGLNDSKRVIKAIGQGVVSAKYLEVFDSAELELNTNIGPVLYVISKSNGATLYDKLVNGEYVQSSDYSEEQINAIIEDNINEEVRDLLNGYFKDNSTNHAELVDKYLSPLADYFPNMPTKYRNTQLINNALESFFIDNVSITKTPFGYGKSLARSIKDSDVSLTMFGNKKSSSIAKALEVGRMTKKGISQYVPYALIGTNVKSDLVNQAYEQANSIYDSLVKNKKKIKDINLNINGESIDEINDFISQDTLNRYMSIIISALQKKGVTFKSITSTGQTGYAEAAIQAGKNLKIPVNIIVGADLIHRTRESASNEDETKRNIKNDSISFWERFVNNPQILNAKAMGIQVSDALYEARYRGDSKSPVFQQGKAPQTVMQDKSRLHRDFTSSEKENRVVLISNMFSHQIDQLEEAYKEELTRQIDQAIKDNDNDLYNSLKQDADNIDRADFIRNTGAEILFKGVRESFNDYINLSENQQFRSVAQELIERGFQEDYGWTDEVLASVAKTWAVKRNIEYAKILNNFDRLAFESTRILQDTEGIKFNPVYNRIVEEGNDIQNEDDIDTGQKDSISSEEQVKENWMSEFRQVSSQDSLSKEVREYLQTIRKTDKQGEFILDELGFTSIMNPGYIHAILLDTFQSMTDVEDMMSLLENLSKTRPWARQILADFQTENVEESVEEYGEDMSEVEKDQLRQEIINDNKNKEDLKSKFYRNYNKDFNNYWIQVSSTNKEGVITTKTIPINKPNGIFYLLSGWRDNYESGNLIDDNSIYDQDSNINKENAQIGAQLIALLQKNTKTNDTEAFRNILNPNSNTQMFTTLVKTLEMIGIDVNEDMLSNIIALSETEKDMNNIKKLIENLGIIFNGVVKDKVADKVDEETQEVVKGDLLNTFDNAYKEIATTLEGFNTNAIEASFREAGKSYYSFTPPNLLKRVINQFKMKDSNPEKWQRFIQDSYLKYDFFNDHNGWLLELINNPKALDILEHKVLLNRDKEEYSDQSAAVYTQAIFAEYLSDPNADKEPGIATAFFHIPIMSDAGASEFIKFFRYHRDGIYKVGNVNMNYKEFLNIKFQDIVMQEFNRMTDVANLFMERLMGRPQALPIKNMDIPITDRMLEESEKQDLINKYNNSTNAEFIKYLSNFIDKKYPLKADEFKAGMQFKFMPALNNTEVLQIIDDMTIKGNINNGKQRLTDLIDNYFKDSVDETIEELNKKQLFALSEEGKPINFKGYKSNKNKNNSLLKSIGFIEKELAKTKRTIPELKEISNIINRNAIINPRQVNALLQDAVDQILELKNPVLDKYLEKNLPTMAYESDLWDIAEEYALNSMYATSQIVQLFATDYAYFKNPEDFQKRFKMYYSPAERLNTHSKYGREKERSIYLNDLTIPAPTYQSIDNIFTEAVESGRINAEQKASIMQAYQTVEVTDGQALRSLSSMRAVLDMAGEWTNELDRAFTNIKENKWDARDMDVLIQPIKQFTATNTSQEIGPNTYRKVPTQHKNSELLLMASYMLSGNMHKSPVMRAINDFLEDSFDPNDKNAGIDVIQFNSAVKVGISGSIDITKLESYNEVYDTLSKAVYQDGTKLFRPERVHEIDYQEYGIQVATPEHHYDTQQLIGSQFRKLITADMDDNTIIRVPGRGDITFKEWYKEYNEVIVANIIDSYEETKQVFDDIYQLENILSDEIMSSGRYSLDLLDACKVQTITTEDGLTTREFAIPLFEPIQINRTMSLANSLIKSRITKQKIKGGSLIQASNFGYDKDLSIRYNDKEGNLIASLQEFLDKGHTEEQYKNYLEQNKAHSIAYFEAYMPWYSKEYIEPLLDANGNMDVNKLPEELRKVIAYRVPTEDAYSMIHIQIKGFTPPQMGGVLLLPAEITSISGSDFDIDKMYIFLPEFKVEYPKTDMDKVYKDFYNKYPQIKDKLEARREEAFNISLQNLIDEQGAEVVQKYDIDELRESHFKQEEGRGVYLETFMSNEEYTLFDNFFKTNKGDYAIGKPTISKVEYDTNKSALQNTKQATNNRFLDLVWAKMSHPDTASRTLKPGGFDNIKRTARIINSLQKISPQKIAEVLDLSKDFNYEEFIQALLKAENNKLDLLYNITQGSINPLSVDTQIYFQEQNMTGKALVAIYANHNAHHALMQHTDIFVNRPKEEAIYLAGTTKDSLHDKLNDKGQYISNNTASYLAAAVDNAKEPLLMFLHLNTLTADSGALLSRLGYTSDDIGMFLNQPIVKEIYEQLKRTKKVGGSFTTSYNKIVHQYSEKIKELEAKQEKIPTSDQLPTYFNSNNVLQNMFSTEYNALNIILGNQYDNLNDLQKIKFLKDQILVAENLDKIQVTAQDLSLITQAHKADTQGGGAGPTIGDTLNSLFKIRDLYNKDSIGELTIGGFTDIINLNIPEGLSREELNKEIMKSPAPLLQAFFTLGVQRSEEMLREYFPHYNQNIYNIIDEIRKKTKFDSLTPKQINDIVNDLMAYKARQIDFFKGDESQGITETNTRSQFINGFPLYYKRVLEENPDIAENEFIKSLSINRASTKAPVDYVSFRNVGTLTQKTKDAIGFALENLMSSSEIGYELILNLVKYAYFRNGFGFGSSSYMHLVTTYVKQNIPGYLDSLREFSNDNDNYRYFIGQFIRNHLHDRSIVPLFDPKEISIIQKTGDFKGHPVDRFVLYADQRSPSNIMKIVKDFTTSGFREYIAIKNGRNFVYYQRTGNEVKDKTITGQYTRIYPLGYENQFKEYVYGVPSESVNSVIMQNLPPSIRRQIVEQTKKEAIHESENVQTTKTEIASTNNTLKDRFMAFDASNTPAQNTPSPAPTSDFFKASQDRLSALIDNLSSEQSAAFGIIDHTRTITFDDIPTVQERDDEDNELCK